MEENLRIRGIFTVVKFIVNSNFDEKNQNRILTKTLGKFGVVDTDYNGPCPNHDEFWLVKIVKEIKVNSPKGCIVLTPIMKLDKRQVKTIVPGMGFSTEYEELGICYVTPTNKQNYYMIPLEYRKLNKVHRVTICVNPGFINGSSAAPVASEASEISDSSQASSKHSSSNNPYSPRGGWDEESIKAYEPSSSSTH